MTVSDPPGLVYSEYPSLQRTWDGIMFDTDVGPPFLVESNSRLLLVGFVDESTEYSSHIAGVEIWELIDIPPAMMQWRPLTSMPTSHFERIRPAFRNCNVLGAFLSFQLQGSAHGELVYIYQASRGSSPVFLCDLSQQPPAWTLIHDSVVRQTDYADIHGCVIDLRLDTLI